MVQLFTKEFFEFADKHPEYQLAHFNHILERNKIQWGVDNLKDLKTDELDAECILALMMGAFRMDQFLKGALFLFFKEGFIVKWLKRLKEIDQKAAPEELEEIRFEVGGFGILETYCLAFHQNGTAYQKTALFGPEFDKWFTSEETVVLKKEFFALHT